MTREEAIKGLTSLVEVRRKYVGMQTMKDEIECLEMAIKALNQEWILTSERPPEIDDEVIAYDGADAFVAWYGVNGWHSTDNSFDPYVPIIAWKPINPPITEDKSNESDWKEYYESKFMKKV